MATAILSPGSALWKNVSSGGVAAGAGTETDSVVTSVNEVATGTVSETPAVGIAASEITGSASTGAGTTDSLFGVVKFSPTGASSGPFCACPGISSGGCPAADSGAGRSGGLDSDGISGVISGSVLLSLIAHHWRERSAGGPKAQTHRSTLALYLHRPRLPQWYPTRESSLHPALIVGRIRPFGV